MYVYDILLSYLYNEKCFKINCVEKNQNTRYMVNNFSKKSCRLWDIVKCGRASQATDDNMAHAHCMLDNYGYEHTLGM